MKEIKILFAGALLETFNLSFFYLALKFEVASFLVAFKRAGCILLSSVTGKLVYKEKLTMFIYYLNSIFNFFFFKKNSGIL
jgi:hypothetical protein